MFPGEAASNSRPCRAIVVDWREESAYPRGADESGTVQGEWEDKVCGGDGVWGDGVWGRRGVGVGRETGDRGEGGVVGNFEQVRFYTS